MGHSICKKCGKAYQIYGYNGICDDCGIPDFTPEDVDEATDLFIKKLSIRK